MRKWRLFENQIFLENACKMGLGTIIKTENEGVKGGGTWSKAVCPRWPCGKCGLL